MEELINHPYRDHFNSEESLLSYLVQEELVSLQPLAGLEPLTLLVHTLGQFIPTRLLRWMGFTVIETDKEEDATLDSVQS